MRIIATLGTTNLLYVILRTLNINRLINEKIRTIQNDRFVTVSCVATTPRSVLIGQSVILLRI